MEFVSKKLIEVLKKYRHKKLFIINHGGNYGDYIIFKGFKKIINFLNIDYKIITHQKFMNSDIPVESVAYIQGGGGFNHYWCDNVIEEMIKLVSCHSGITIVGPQTFINDENFLKKEVFGKIYRKKSKKVHIFTRELVSYKLLKNFIPSSYELDHDHDTALNLTKDDFKQQQESRYTLYGIRSDLEAYYPIKKHSPLCLWIDPVSYSKNFDQWILLHSRAKCVVTNRLHSAIISSIFGKPTTIMPNSYHKNRSVWEYSLADRGVEWKDSLEVNNLTKRLRNWKIYQKFINSYIPNRVILPFMHGVK